MELKIYPAEVLRQVSEKVEAMDPRIEEIIEFMFAIMHEKGGIGLAAPQIGVSKRIITVDTEKYYEGGKKFIIINPEIVDKAGRDSHEEGCLSIPGITAPVMRATKLFCKGMSAEGKDIEMELDDLLSRVVQHERDHLDGILFTDKVSPVAMIRIKKQLKQLEELYNT